MIQRMIDDRADIYLMLMNNDRRLKLASLRRAENAVITLGVVIFFLTALVAGFVGWLGFIANESGSSAGGLEFEHIFFPVVLFVEVAAARTAKNSVPLWILLATAVLATVVTYGIFVYFIIYSILLIAVEIKMAAMKNVPGYPAFEDIPTAETMKKDMTADQLIAWNKKWYADMADKEAARERDSRNLDRILSGEIGLDEFLGVEKKDARNVKMDESIELPEQPKPQPEEDIDDDSAEAFFRRFEKQGGALEKKKDESESWLDGGDANSAESYFSKFEESGGKLEEDRLLRPKITFDRVKTKKNGGSND